MKALFKKPIAVILAALLLLTAFPLTATAATTAEQSTGASSGTTGSCTWTLDNNGTLTISGNGAMGNYASNSTLPWGKSITSVVIENGVTSIGDYAFYYCTGLTSVTIGNSVSSIGIRSFQNCTGLTSVTIGNSVTSIDYQAFEGCTGLTSVTIPDGDISIGYSAFYNTAWYNSQPDGLVYAGKVAYKYKGAMPANTSIALKDGTKGIADSAFSGCTGLTSVTIPDSVTSIGDSAFSGCTGLKGVYISDLAAWCSIIFGNYSSNPLVYAHKLYLNNQHVTDLNIPEGVINISSFAYSGCTRLTSVTIPDSVTSIGEDAFYGCTGLTSVTIPDSVTSIGYAAFYGCTGLTGITIPDSVTSIRYAAFSGCTGLTSVTIPDSVTSIGGSAFYNTAWYNSQPDGLVYAGKVAYEYKGAMPANTSIALKDGTKGIADYAFYGCTRLTSVTIGNSVTRIGYMAFHNCTGLTSITIPDSVTSIGGFAFHNCTGLTSVTIGNGVTSIENCAFSACTGLTGITIGNSVTSIGSSAFYGCTKLTSVTIPDSVTSIGEKAFGYYYNNGYKKISWFTIYGVKGSAAENYALSNSFKFVSLDVQPTEPTTAEPTTVEPTTEEPTTEEPTTAEPTTEEPTTEEPTTEQPDIPQKTDVTIKLAAPVSTFASRYTWNDAVFYYGNTTSFDDLTKVSMTDTGEKFYTTGTFNSTIITPGAWKIYSVTLTAEQIQAVDASKFAGFATSDNVNRTKLAKNANVFSAANGEYANYSSAASGAGGFDGKTFVFANASYGSTSPISYMGYWINSYVTVKAAAPMANTSYSRWDSMQLYYGNTAALADMQTVDLFNTKETTKVTNSGDMTIKNGRWYIYAITLTDTQANAVDSAAYVGFKKAGAENRTSIMMNVLKAKTNSFDGTYGAKRTLNDLEGQVFVISGQTKTGISVATYVGQWKTRDVYTAGDNDEITIYFAVPKAVKAVDSWDTGVEFYYSNENNYKDAARMQMTPEPDYDIYSDFSGETFEQGSCSVYSLTIPAVKVREIDECKKVGFVKKGSYNRTYYAQGYAVTRASSVSDNQSYGLPQSIEAFDGNIFVITGCTDPNNERVTYTGWWN